MTRKSLLALVLLASVAGIAWAQTTAPLFVPIQQIGQRRPQGIQYDPNFDRLVQVDLQGRLLLADAATFQPQHILYEQGAYYGYAFSHDGRYLALAIDRRVELWDTQSGQMRVRFEPEGANLVQGPLVFSPDDSWLLLDTVVPAPQATRRSENDTNIIPWIWDLPAARDEAPARLRGGVETFAFFNFRNGLVLGGNMFLVAGIPNRLQVIDGRTNAFNVVADIPSSRAERDPIYVWHSANSDLMYVDPQFDNQFVQIDAQTGTVFNLPLGRDLNYSNLETMRDLQLGKSARILCQPNSLRETPLLRRLYGDNFLIFQGYLPQTFMLIDLLEPLSTGATQPALLIYNFVEARGRGSLELLRPQDTSHMRLSPDGSRLLLRRASGLQPIEVYNLETCGLEQTIYPAELDESGTRLLDYRADGKVIVADFQRFDAQNGAELAFEEQYTTGFETYYFSDDGRHLHTIRGGELRVWEVATGQLLQRAPITLNGDVIARSPDATRYLTQSFTENLVIETVNVLGGERQQLIIPYNQLGAINQVIPSPDWKQVLLVYSPNHTTDSSGGNEIAVYAFDAGQILHAGAADLPANAYEFGWVDNERLYVTGDAFSGQPVRLYGLDYDPSGLPACLVQAFPDEYPAWLPIWEGLTLRLGEAEVGRLTERLCAALPAQADEVVSVLTPTPRFFYNSLNTPVPYLIPGVPVCLTERFASRAVDYAALWRNITAGLDEAQITLLEEMICEGLISSPFQVGATPTIDPNLNVPATPTPVDATPITTEGSARTDLLVYVFDVATGSRLAGNYQPALVRPAQRDVNFLYNFYIEQFNNEAPINPVLSSDGTLYAVTDNNGFVKVYRLTRSYDSLRQDEISAEATRQAEAPRSVGLAPTATQPFDYIGDVRPTLTPTITPTAPARPETTANPGQTEEVCPARQLYTLPDAPADFSAGGRLFTAPPPNGFPSVWVLEPDTGKFSADDSLPRCGLDENCTFSFDRQWVARIGTSFIVSRPDGSQATILFRPEEMTYFTQSVRWVNNTLLEYSYSGYLTDALVEQLWAERGEAFMQQRTASPLTLYRHFDVTTGQRSEPFLLPDMVQVYDLPTSLIGSQPLDGPLLLVSTPYPPFGAKYYLYNRDTDTFEYFARVDSGSLFAEWHPLGNYLYYQFPDDNQVYVYDVTAQQHRTLDELPRGVWSPDGRQRAQWYTMPDKEYAERIRANELPFRIRIWDSATGAFRFYCLPESGTGFDSSGSDLFWSPDGRYLAFVLNLPITGDIFPTATVEFPIPGTPLPTLTPVPLEAQYQYGKPRTLLLDTQTGTITIISTEVQSLLMWADEAGAR